MNHSASPARSRFARLVAVPEQELELARGALLIAAEEYPQLVPEPYLQRLDILAERVRDRLSLESAPLLVLQELSRVLFEEEGFRGNTSDYYDVHNSFLNDVLDRRTGIPITLGIICLEVGWRLGLPLEGVNFPGHFLVRYPGEAVRLLVDPFHRGQIRFEEDAQELLDRVYGGSVRLRPSYLRPAGRRDILARLLANLKSIYLNQHDDVRALAALERILLLRPDSAEDVRDRALVLVRLERAAEAVPELKRYLQLEPEAGDRGRILLLLERLEGDAA